MTTFSEMRHFQECNHIVSPVKWFKRLRLWLYWRLQNPVPLWLAVLFIAFCLFAAKSVVMVGGMR